MKLTTDIVLVGNEGRTQPYVVELIPSDSLVGNFTFRRSVDVDPSNKTSYLFSNSYSSYLIKNENDWYNITLDGTSYQGQKQATIRLYFPQYSVDTFSNKSKYILTLCTYIHGIEVQLGNFEFERKDALACAPVRFDGMDEYYEYMDFHIINPYSLLFSSDTGPIRESLGCPTDSNYVSSLLHVCLFVVDESEDGYIKKDGWTGGQNSIMVGDPADLQSHAKYNIQDRTIDLDVTFNEEYDDLLDYFTETYGLERVAAVIQYIVSDSDDVYYEQSKLYETIEDADFHFNIDIDEGSVLDPRADAPSFDNSYIDSFDAYTTPYYSGVVYFDSRDNWKPGLKIQSSIMFYDASHEYDLNFPFITIMSNKLYLTPELFVYMVNENRGVGDNLIPTVINLETLDMDNVNLKATNKIIQNVQVVTPTDSTKKHLLQPVFYQTRNIENIILHPAVTENIALNLDSYKGNVDRFKLQIEGVIFNEVGRTSKGVVFKVVGNMLPKEANEGTMYVLDQNNDLVTTGKYVYVF